MTECNKKSKVLEKIGPIMLPLSIDGLEIVNFELTLYQLSMRNYQVLTYFPSPPTDTVLLRIESACTFAHLYGSKLCDCREQLEAALSIIRREGGVLIYALDDHGRGVGLKNHVCVYEVEQTGIDTVEAHKSLGLEVDARHYEDVLEILHDMGIKKAKLLTNNPSRINFLKRHLDYLERIPLENFITPYNIRELMTKKEKMGHFFAFKSDKEWLSEIFNTRELVSPFTLIESSKSTIYKGDLIGLIEFLNNRKVSMEVFYTIYCSPEMSDYTKVKELIIMLKKEKLVNHNLRIIISIGIELEIYRQLFKFAIINGIRELKYLSDLSNEEK